MGGGSGGVFPEKILGHALQTLANAGYALLEKCYKVFGQISMIISQKSGESGPLIPPLGKLPKVVFDTGFIIRSFSILWGTK